jgi:hypothetical protein
VDEKWVKYLVRKPEKTIWEKQEEVDEDNIELEIKYIGFKGLELIHPFENSLH